jgi:hypothetical protein
MYPRIILLPSTAIIKSLGGQLIGTLDIRFFFDRPCSLKKKHGNISKNFRERPSSSLVGQPMATLEALKRVAVH